jgi:hypothetical protein
MMFFPVYFSLRGPVITHQIDDKVTRFYGFNTRTDFENSANAIGPKRGREIEPDPVVSPARHDVSWVDWEGDYLKDNLVRRRGSNIRRLNATRHFLRRPITLQLGLFHDEYLSPS